METILARDMVRDYTAEYATYVATSRSVCSLIDGLKPVQRRCINAASDLKLYHNKKHMKVSKLAGDVMGSYHPHGGANPVLMAQPFRFRYPLFDGQGNYGSPDMPDSYAAARYLEIRLSKFCEDFYLESADYADREDNYDGRLKEVTQYYPALPGSLFTGASGIAVGFSTEIPTHTITDIGNSLLAYIKDPSSTKYMDNLYPETCEKSIVLTPFSDIQKLYRTGEGSIRYKASTHYETIGGKSALVVDAFPPGFSKKRLETPSIMDAVDKGLLEVSNESAENIRYVFISPEKKVLEDLEERLSSSVGYRMYIEHRGVIKLYKLCEIYDTFLEERKSYIIRKYVGISDRLSEESSYLNALLSLKKDKEYIRTMFDKSSEEVVHDIVSRYRTTESIAKKVISVNIKTLLKDNIVNIEERLSLINELLEEYSSYIRNPIDKVVLDIKSFTKNYKNEVKNASHIDEYSSEFTIKYNKTSMKIYSNRSYFIGYSDNRVSLMYGEDLRSINPSEVIICPADKEYYFLYDGKGCCSMTGDLLSKVGSKLNSSSLVGIIGVNDLDHITIKQGNGKVYNGVGWSLRQKLSYIRLSKDGEPDFKVLSP